MPEGRFRRLAVAIAIVGALHGLLYVPLLSSNTGTDTRTYTKSATALLHGSYTTPLWAGFYFTYPDGFYDLTGVHLAPAFGPVFFAPERQAFRPPGYPLLLAAVGGGGGDASEVAALVAQATLFGGGAFFLMLATRRWWGPRIALAAGVVYAVDPYSKHYVALVLSETLAGFLLLAGIYAYTRAHQERSTGWWTAAGALAAALTLTRAVFAVAVPLVLLAALVPRGNRMRNGAAALASAAVLLVPWLAWTDHVTGK